MKKILITLFAVTMFAAAHAQSISNVDTYVSIESPYHEIGEVYYASDSIYFEFTVHFPYLNDLELTNDELYAYVHLMDYTNGLWANGYIVAEAGESFTVGTIPYGVTKTYKGAYYVGNITTTSDMEISFASSFSTTSTIISGNGLVSFTYNP
ncbi:hypothetical protein HB364_20550 [Pseudoflavitalea sp. X16]|uniref:hypothetical protein n=1 Tax=Paraflavitalea devenefica TaxID=2716334 RepID=UPI00142045AC|nr:hypothetical protein [Paraflavitalea devenefica]NII27491.1 hypothetical protein [Paraflavitalea devenefica]